MLMQLVACGPPVIEEPVVHAGGVEEVEAGQAPDHVAGEEVPEADHAVLAPVLHWAVPLTRPNDKPGDVKLSQLLSLCTSYKSHYNRMQGQRF